MCGGVRCVRHGVAHLAVADVLDGRDEIAHLTAEQLIHRNHRGRKDADLIDDELAAVVHHADAHAARNAPVNDPDVDHDTAICVVLRVEDERPQRAVTIALRRRHAFDDRLEHEIDADPLPRAGEDRVIGGDADHLLDLATHQLRVSVGEVDLVDDRDHLEVIVDRLVHVGECLRLNALGCVHHEERALACCKGSRDLVGKVDMSRRVDEVQLIRDRVGCRVCEADGLRLDGDAALALEVELVEHLVLHVAQRDSAGRLEQPIRKGGLAVIDVRDDAEVADPVKTHASRKES